MQTIRKVGEWIITLQPQRDVALPWRATATNLFNGDFATGFDREDTLKNISQKLGLDPQMTLKEFGL